MNTLHVNATAGKAGGVEAAWAKHAKALAAWVDTHMVNRRDCFGHYIAEQFRTDPDLTAFTDKSGLAVPVIERHIKARNAGDLIGLHSTVRDEPAGEGEAAACWSRWLAVDIDRHGEDGSADVNLAVAEEWYGRASRLGFIPLLLDSNGRGGFHLIVIFDAPTPTEKVHAFGKWLTRDWKELGLTEAPELFPKQPAIAPGGFGNWLRLFGRHHTRPHYTRVWDGSKWLEGAAAIAAILATRGTDAAAIPAEALAPKVTPKPQTPARTSRMTVPAVMTEAQKAAAALEYVTDLADPYPDWIKIGLCLTELGTEGLALWESWSQGSSKFGEGDCERKWKSFRRAQGQTDVTLATLFYKAKERGWAPPCTPRTNGTAKPPGVNGTAHSEPQKAARETPPFSLGLVDSASFFAQDYPVEWLIKGVTVASEPAVIGGPSKALKTSILIDKVVSLGTGTPFLGRFDVPTPRRVALLSGESGRRVIQSSARRVCEARGLTAADLGNVCWGFTLPQLTNAEHLVVLRKTIEDRGLEYLAIDPFYLTLMAGNAGVDPKNMFEMGPILYDVANTCLEVGCTPELAHHFTKKREDTYGSPDLSELAYAGIGQFVRQWTLIAPREKFDAEVGLFKLHFAYGGSAGHCGEFAVDIEVGKLEPDLDRRCWKVSIATPSEERAALQEQRAAEAARKKAEKDQTTAMERDKAERDAMGEAMALLRKTHPMSATQLRTATGWRKEKADRALFLLVQNGLARSFDSRVIAGNGAGVNCKVFEPTPEDTV